MRKFIAKNDSLLRSASRNLDELFADGQISLDDYQKRIERLENVSKERNQPYQDILDDRLKKQWLEKVNNPKMLTAEQMLMQEAIKRGHHPGKVRRLSFSQLDELLNQ
ncbi:hypothetical protein [Vibrio europaeus]|uniref:hypothetical protein n=1 Tax=Vibrio europaeus TaxID=300876 RepID=UPI00233F6BF9|nr:hypothetical protein [Vibrio europaeus]MDC5838641.1 hypothetical protein [Vibrio europaeus]MDC5856403.1 hypothetical protein [Vibrio europaeus]